MALGHQSVLQANQAGAAYWEPPWLQRKYRGLADLLGTLDVLAAVVPSLPVQIDMLFHSGFHPYPCGYVGVCRLIFADGMSWDSKPKNPSP